MDKWLLKLPKNKKTHDSNEGDREVEASSSSSCTVVELDKNVGSVFVYCFLLAKIARYFVYSTTTKQAHNALIYSCVYKISTLLVFLANSIGTYRRLYTNKNGI